MDQNLNQLENFGAWKSIQVASEDEIKFCPEILTNSNSYKLEIFGAAETIDLLPLVENISVSESKQRTKSGILHRIKITVEFNCATEVLDSYFKKYLHKKVIAVCQDNNASEKVYGSKNHLLFFNYQESRGKKAEQGVKTTLTIDGKIPQKPVYINVSMV